MTPLLLGLDIGTTSAKAAIADIHGEALWTASAAYSYQTPRPGWAEQNPEDWWSAATAAVRSLLAQRPDARERIVAAAVSGQGVAAALLGADGKPLRPAILWLDVRCASQAGRLDREAGERIAQISGKRPAAYNVEPKLLWLKENEPDVFKSAWKSMTATAYVAYRLTGRPVMNYSDGGILLAYDLQKNQWSRELLDLVNLPASLYCDLAPCDQVIGKITPEAAAATGLSPETLVVAGGEDTSSAGLALGVATADDALLSLGSACTMYIPAEHPAIDPRLLAFPHVIDGLTLVGGSMVGGGNTMDWIARAVAAPGKARQDDSRLPAEFLDELTREAASAPAGSGGVVFLPYLAGELQPVNDGFARGVFFGLSLATRRAELVRAVMEGTAFAIRHNLEVAASTGARPQRLAAVGGPARNEVWAQIMADVTELPIQVMEENGGAALGDAALAAKGAGLIESFQPMIQAHARKRRLFRPDPAAVGCYQPLFDIYKGLYPRLKDLFHQAAAE